MLNSDIDNSSADNMARPVSMKVQVVVRIKPNHSEQISTSLQRKASKSNALDVTSENEIRILEDHNIAGNGPRVFKYDHVFDVDTNQQQVYNVAVADLTDRFFEGYNVTVMAYGQTSSGKTYTMGTGVDSNTKGVVNFALEHIFTQTQASLLKNDDTRREFAVSFIEIYNDDLIDLTLDHNSASIIQIREDNNGRIIWSGVNEKKIYSAQEALEILKRGASNRQTGSTKMNSQSSRSHAIFSVIQTQTKINSGVEMRSVSKFNFVDLAGSERLKKTQSVGNRAKEGISINSGLLALGNVISALSTAQNRSTAKNGFFIPYRVSKLTRLLQDSLGGTAYTIMIACVSMSSTDVVETIDTLKYASKASSISNKGTNNWESIDASLHTQILTLKQDISRLQDKLKDKDLIIKTHTVDSTNAGTLNNNLLYQLDYQNQIQDMQLELETSNKAYSELLTKFNELCQDFENSSIYPSKNSKSYTNNHLSNPLSLKYDNMSSQSKLNYSHNLIDSDESKRHSNFGDSALLNNFTSKNNFTDTIDSFNSPYRLSSEVSDVKLNAIISNNKAMAFIDSIGSDKRFSRIPRIKNKHKTPSKAVHSGIDFDYNTSSNLDFIRKKDLQGESDLDSDSRNSSLYQLSEENQLPQDYYSEDLYSANNSGDQKSMKYDSGNDFDNDYKQVIRELKIELSELQDELKFKNSQLEINQTKLEFAEQTNEMLSLKQKSIGKNLEISEQNSSVEILVYNDLKQKCDDIQQKYDQLQKINSQQQQEIEAQRQKTYTSIGTITNNELENGLDTINILHSKEIEDIVSVNEKLKQDYDKEIQELSMFNLIKSKKNIQEHSKEIERLIQDNQAQNEKIKQEHANEIKELSLINQTRYEKTIQDHAKEIDELSLLNQSQHKKIIDHAKEIEELSLINQARFEKIAQEHSKEIDRIMLDNRAQNEKIEQEYSKEIEDLIIINQTQYATIKQKHAVEIDHTMLNNQAQNEKIEQEHTKEIEELSLFNQTRYEKIIQDHAKEIEELSLMNQAQNEKIKQDHAKKMEKLSLLNQTECEKIKQDHAKEIEELLLLNQAHNEAIRNDHAKEIERIMLDNQTQHEKNIQYHEQELFQRELDFKNYILDVDTKYTNEINALKQEHAASLLEMNQAHREIKTYSSSVQTSDSSFESSCSEFAESMSLNLNDNLVTTNNRDLTTKQNTYSNEDLKVYKKKITLILQFLQNQVFERTSSLKKLQDIVQKNISLDYMSDNQSLLLRSSVFSDDMAVIDYNKYKQRIENIKQMSIGEKKHMLTRESHSYQTLICSEDNNIKSGLLKTPLLASSIPCLYTDNFKYCYTDKKRTELSKLYSPRYKNNLSLYSYKFNPNSASYNKFTQNTDSINQILLSPLGIYANQEIEYSPDYRRSKATTSDMINSPRLSVNAFIDSEIPLVSVENIFTANVIYGTDSNKYKAIQGSPTLVNNFVFDDAVNTLDKLTNLIKESIDNSKKIKAKSADLHKKSISYKELISFSHIVDCEQTDFELIFSSYKELLSQLERANISKQNLMLVNERLCTALETLEAQSVLLIGYFNSLPLNLQGKRNSLEAISLSKKDNESQKPSDNNEFTIKNFDKKTEFNKSTNSLGSKTPISIRKKSKLSLYNIIDGDSSTEMINKNLEILENSGKTNDQKLSTVPIHLYENILTERNELLQKISSYQILINEQHLRLRRQDKTLAAIPGSHKIASLKSISVNNFKDKNIVHRILSTGNINLPKSKISFDSSLSELFDSQRHGLSIKVSEKNLNKSIECLRKKSTLQKSISEYSLVGNKDNGSCPIHESSVFLVSNKEKDFKNGDLHKPTNDDAGNLIINQNPITNASKPADCAVINSSIDIIDNNNRDINSSNQNNSSLFLSFDSSPDIGKNNLVFSGLDVNSFLDSDKLNILNGSFDSAGIKDFESNYAETNMSDMKLNVLDNIIEDKSDIIHSSELEISEFKSIDNFNIYNQKNSSNVETKLTKDKNVIIKQDFSEENRDSLIKGISNEKRMEDILEGSYSFGESCSDPGVNLQHIDEEMMKLQVRLQDAMGQLHDSENNLEKQNEVIQKLESDLKTHTLLITALETNLTNCEQQIIEYKEDSTKYANELLRSKSECKTLNEQIKQLTFRLEESKTAATQITHDRDIWKIRYQDLRNETEGADQKKKSSFFCF
ncbi:hypothetical protein BB561_001763 [Smittium simulii]|uniref:Kinesin motor domain-containing protein n=1 Tax=Smittium simulii TaxID=133385 RepID=A0A2T9YT97_9FUNG|nr:hypothetical protein BB561_001763 [Smittium simulii]